MMAKAFFEDESGVRLSLSTPPGYDLRIADHRLDSAAQDKRRNNAIVIFKEGEEVD